MKKIFFLAIILIITETVCFSQVADTSIKPMTRLDYLQRSRSNRTGSWVALGLGLALDIAGIATTISNAKKEIVFFPSTTEKKSVDHTGEYFLYVLGTAALTTSVCLSFAAHRLKKKAATFSFKNEGVSLLQNGSIAYKYIPSFGFKIRI